MRYAIVIEKHHQTMLPICRTCQDVATGDTIQETKTLIREVAFH